MSERLNSQRQFSPAPEPLPPDLAQLEAELAQLPIPPSTLNHDQLLYQAGWAAAEANFAANESATSFAVKGQRASLPRWVWPTTSAVLAATLLLQLVALRPRLPRPTEAVTAHLIEQSSTPAATKSLAMPTSKFVTPNAASSAKPTAATGNLFDLDSPEILFATAYRHTFQQRRHPPRQLPHDDTLATPSKTSQELLQELLPEFQRPPVNTAQPTENPWSWPQQLWEMFS